MFSGEELVAELRVMGVTHVVWLPDSTLGAWDGALESAADIVLIRVSREAEIEGIDVPAMPFRRMRSRSAWVGLSARSVLLNLKTPGR